MEVKIFFKPMKVYSNYNFDEAEFARMESDFRAYIESEKKEPAGGSYLCREYDFMGGLSEAKKIFIQFSDTVIH